MITVSEQAAAFPNNVVNGQGAPLDAGGETLFLSRVFEALETIMSADFGRFTFVVHRWSYHEKKGANIDLLAGDANKVLILIADERELFPTEEYPAYRAIFRAYGNPPGGKSRTHSFPIGYLNPSGGVDSMPFDRRTTGLFFSGYLNRNRVDLYKQFRRIDWLPKGNLRGRYPKELARRVVEKLCTERTFDKTFPDSSITFTNWFGKGLPPAEYAKTLANSKIALCPPGFVSHETIRHWEAMRLGCIIISSPLPPNRFYRGSPIIELQDWSELATVVHDLLGDPEEMRIRHEATERWWHEMCSESAVARYVAGILGSPGNS